MSSTNDKSSSLAMRTADRNVHVSQKMYWHIPLSKQRGPIDNGSLSVEPPSVGSGTSNRAESVLARVISFPRYGR